MKNALVSWLFFSETVLPPSLRTVAILCRRPFDTTDPFRIDPEFDRNPTSLNTFDVSLECFNG